MGERKKKTHPSFGKISVSRFHGHGEFFGSDLVHNGGVSIEISGAYLERDVARDWIYSEDTKIRVQMSYNQYIDMITSGMNTDGVPCTILGENGKRIEQISHSKDNKEIFKKDFNKLNEDLFNRIDELDAKLEGNIGKKKLAEIKHELGVIKSHLKSNTPFVMKSFEEEMNNVVTEAKHSISNYLDNKIHTLGLEAIKGDIVKLNE